MDNFDQSIGASLRAARERRNLSIADCAQRTKIRAKYLQALEEEEFGMLPEPGYARSFLRTYASSLGIEPTELTKIFDRIPEQVGSRPNAVELEARDAPRNPSRRPPRRRNRNRSAFLALVGAIVVIGLGYLASRGFAAPGGIEAIQPRSYFSR